MNKNNLTRFVASTFAALLSFNALSSEDAPQRSLEITDIMKFKSIVSPQITEQGKWIGYSAQPDRGDNSYHILSTDSAINYQVEFGSKATFSADGRYVAVTVTPELLLKEKTDKKEQKNLKNDLVVIELSNGQRTTFKSVEQFALSDKSGYLAFTVKDKKENEAEKPSATPEEKTKEPTSPNKADKLTLTNKEKSKESAKQDVAEKTKLFNKKRIKHTLTLVNLKTLSEQQINDVDSFSFSSKKPLFAYSTSTEDGKNNSLNVINLKSNKTQVIKVDEKAAFNHLSWGQKGQQLAFLHGSFADKVDERKHQVKIWSSKNKLTTIKHNLNNWFVSDTNKLTWSLDNQRLFFGFKPAVKKTEEVSTKPETHTDLYNTDKLVAGRNLQIWHGDDPLIKTNEKYQLGKDKKHTFTGVYHVKNKKFIQLADKSLLNVSATNHKTAVIGSSDLKYRKLRTWEGFFSDYYIVNLKSGNKSLITEKLSSYSDVSLSESGRYAAFYKDQHIWLYDVKNNQTINLTDKLNTTFADEDHDYPSKVPGYGIAGWLEDDKGILVYDKFDIWQLNVKQKYSKCLTCEVGRPNSLKFRINSLDKEQDYFKKDQTLLLTSYNDEFKNYGFYQLNLKSGKLSKQREENKKFKFIAKAKHADTMIFTREDFNEFPDLWISNFDTATGKKITNVNPQKNEFLWGKPELVDWRSAMGVKHQGILIKPANYIEGVKYPVVVYYYRRFSQRMYEFNQMKVNHRPNFPFYTSNGYAIFLPDVHFEVGTPGHSTNKSIVPGIQKIVDMGVADENAIGLHGHSWSGYQTLHSITETDIFAAAVSGAPVSNMTSAYSGIRLGTGLARQFQYEQGQSRIGASLFERRDLYIENSPVFFADRINTPLMMQFGDIDDAVPWQQGVEMYMAMRRLNKNVILLQYEGEPHHLKKYPNKVDYTIKMKQYFDHYLKGAPAAKWMIEGEAYREKKADK